MKYTKSDSEALFNGKPAAVECGFTAPLEEQLHWRTDASNRQPILDQQDPSENWIGTSPGRLFVDHHVLLDLVGHPISAFKVLPLTIKSNVDGMKLYHVFFDVGQ